MESFCKEDLLLDMNQTWYAATPTFLPCFTRSILLLPSSGCAVLSLVNSLAMVNNKKDVGGKPWSWVLMVRLLLLTAAAATILAQARLEFVVSGLHLVDTLYYGVQIVIIGISMIGEVLMKMTATYTSPYQFFLWLCQVVFLAPIFMETRALEPTFIVYYYFNCSLLISTWFPNWSSPHPSEITTSFPAWVAFSWLSSTFFKGYRKTLEPSELPYTTPSIDISYITQAFNRCKLTLNNKGKKAPKGGTMKILVRAFGATFLWGAVLRFCNDVLLYLTPQIFRMIVRVIEREDHAWKGYFWVLLLLINSSTQVIISNHYFRQTFVAAYQMRAALVTAIYKKTLTISNTARKDFSTGEITNLMSIDAQRFMEIVPYLNTLWSGPFQFILAIYFLYNLVGVSSLVGLAVFFVLVPINIRGGKYMAKIQSKQMKAKDGRILFMNEVLQGMKVLKLYAWEKPFMAKIKEFRDEEIRMILKKAVLQALLWITYTAAPLVVTLATFACYLFIDPVNNVLTAEKVFGTVAIFNVVRIPMNQFPQFVMESVKLFVSVKRVDRFLECSDLGESDSRSTGRSKQESGNAIEFSKADYSWEEKGSNPTLSNLNLSIKKNDLIAVVGKIGSGKSSFLSALLGEMNKVKGEKIVNGGISYVAQQAWIQNLNVKDNILFGAPEDPTFYAQVVDACALRSDLDILPNGDQTEIGENGVNLSGGQKQRVGLARAAYSNADIVLMDDPLSAVDAHVAKHIFEKLIGPNGLLSQRTRILVTHNLGFLHKVDRILLFDDGRIVDDGTLEELQARKSRVFEEMAEFVGKNSEQEEEGRVTDETTQTKKKANDGKLIEKEKSEEGRVSVKHYWFYLKSMNIWLFLLALFYFVTAEAFKVAGNLVLAEWTNNFEPDTNLYYLGMYTLMAVICSITGMLSQVNTNNRCAAASVKLHESLLDKTMHAPLAFFESNPIGRILNRFTSDMDVVDMKIPNQLRQFLSCVFMILGTFFVVSSITPWFLLPLVPISLAFVFLQVYYTRTRRQTKRMESVAKSPIFSHFTESITGATTIRAFNQRDRFCRESEDRVARHLHFNYISDMTNRWLSIRVEILGNLIVFCAAVFAFYSRASIGAGLAGLSISYAMSLIDGFGWCIRMAGELESDSVALERIREYEELPQEAEWDTKGGIAQSWPEQGHIKLMNYETKYRPDLPPVLQDFNLEVSPEEKVGIVGWTGAGKSSLSLALFRILEPTRGTILIDDKDITEIGLQDLRSRLTIIPQEPTLFSGTLRFNLDPANQYTDQQVDSAMVGSGLDYPLDLEVAEGGLGLSLGQRQLVCLARALLRKSKILLLDEATAAVDAATDQRIQETLRHQFSNCSVITIAHRIHTVTGGDRILVLDRGNLVEQGTPSHLLNTRQSRFYAMAKAAGITEEDNL